MQSLPIYLAEVARHCERGVRAAKVLNAAAAYLDAQSAHPGAVSRDVEAEQRALENAYKCADQVASEAAMVAKYLWPIKPNLAKKRSPDYEASCLRRAFSEHRGNVLRAALDVDDTNPLNDRDLRNSIEHFDERIDARLLSSDRILVGQSWGPRHLIGLPEHAGEVLLRHYDPTTGIYSVLDTRISLPAVTAELEVLATRAKNAADMFMLSQHLGHQRVNTRPDDSE